MPTMKWKLRELQGRVLVKTGQNVTTAEIMQGTGLSSQTIANLRQDQSKQVGVKTISSLLAFFSARLGEELTTNDLLEWRPD